MMGRTARRWLRRGAQGADNSLSIDALCGQIYSSSVTDDRAS